MEREQRLPHEMSKAKHEPDIISYAALVKVDPDGGNESRNARSNLAQQRNDEEPIEHEKECQLRADATGRRLAASRVARCTSPCHAALLAWRAVAARGKLQVKLRRLEELRSRA